MKPGEDRHCDLRGAARRQHNQLLMKTISLTTLRSTLKTRGEQMWKESKHYQHHVLIKIELDPKPLNSVPPLSSFTVFHNFNVKLEALTTLFVQAAGRYLPSSRALIIQYGALRRTLG